MARGNPQFAEYGFKKGDGRGGRPKGAQNKTTRMLREAIILAAENSKHSKGDGLVGYLRFLANEKPEVFAQLLGKLLPLQVKAKNEGVGPSPINLNPSMSLPEMIDSFERRIKSIQIPAARRMIEQD